MADIYLRNRECDKGGTPTVCCVCGKRKAAPLQMKFRVRLYSFGNTTVYRIRDGWLPFCAEDKAKHQRRGWIMLGMFGVTFLVFVFVIFGAMFLSMATGGAIFQRTGPLLPCTGFGLCFVMLLATIITAIVIHIGSVRATEINEGGVRVINVHDKFVVAVEEARDDDDDDDRPRRKRKRGYFED